LHTISSFEDLYRYTSRVSSKFCFRLWDVGLGLSIWIQTPNGQNHWIDLGKTEDFSPSDHVSSKYGVKNIDYLLVSHPHADHLSDLPEFIRKFGLPKNLCRNKTLPEKEKFGTLDSDWQKEFKKIDNWLGSNAPWERNPTNPDVNGGVEYKIFCNNYSEEIKGNDTSVVAFLLYKELLIVCPGDIEPKGWDKLWIDNFAVILDLIRRSNKRILVAPHHGRKTTYSEHMMNVISPHLVIISDVYGDAETHPDYREKSKGMNIGNETKKYLSTKRGGRIEITVGPIGQPMVHQYEYS
jgi:beta-lactamase superfamily II metal-dependent hydrolase